MVVISFRNLQQYTMSKLCVLGIKIWVCRCVIISNVENYTTAIAHIIIPHFLHRKGTLINIKYIQTYVMHVMGHWMLYSCDEGHFLLGTRTLHVDAVRQMAAQVTTRRLQRAHHLPGVCWRVIRGLGSRSRRWQTAERPGPRPTRGFLCPQSAFVPREKSERVNEHNMVCVHRVQISPIPVDWIGNAWTNDSCTRFSNQSLCGLLLHRWQIIKCYN